MRLNALILASLVLTSTVQGAPQLQDNDCDPEGSQMQLNYCAELRLSAVNDELNETWKNVLAKLAGRPVAIESLRTAQRLWMELRDADIQARFPLEEGENVRTQYGSIHPLELADAEAQLTRERTRYLRANWLDAAGH